MVAAHSLFPQPKGTTGHHSLSLCLALNFRLNMNIWKNVSKPTCCQQLQMQNSLDLEQQNSENYFINYTLYHSKGRGPTIVLSTRTMLGKWSFYQKELACQVQSQIFVCVCVLIRFFSFSFLKIEAQLIYNVLVSGVQQSDSVLFMYTCIYTYIFFHILLHYSLLQHMEYSSLCYTVSLCCLPIVYTVMCIC